MNNNIDVYKKNLYSAVIADTLDSLGYHKQVLTPGITSLDPNVKICGLARVGLYMPIYHDDEHVNVYEHEIALVDSLQENEVAVLCCHGNKKIAPWGELLSTRASYLKSAGCLTDGCVRDADMIREMNFPVFSKGTNPVDTKFRGKMMMAIIIFPRNFVCTGFVPLEKTGKFISLIISASLTHPSVRQLPY